MIEADAVLARRGQSPMSARGRSIGDPASERLVDSIARSPGVSRAALASILDATGLRDRYQRMRPRLPEASRLNASGAAIQLCVTTAQAPGTPAGMRLIVDPFFDQPPPQRIARSFEMVRAASGRLGGDAAIEALLPVAATPAVGAIWIAWALESIAAPGRCRPDEAIAIYLNPEVFGPNLWPQMQLCLDRLLPASSERRRLVEACMRSCRPVCLALEMTRDRRPRVKLYLRAGDGHPRDVLDLLDPAIRPAGGLEIIRPRGPWPATGVTLGLGFDSDGGAPNGAKVDLCFCPSCRRAARPEPGLEERLFAAMPCAARFAACARLALLGTGGGGKGARINAYFEPC